MLTSGTQYYSYISIQYIYITDRFAMPLQLNYAMIMTQLYRSCDKSLQVLHDIKVMACTRKENNMMNKKNII